MTELLAQPPRADAPIEKVSIIISKGSLEGIYPGLIMANGARMEGIEANRLLHVLRPRRDPQATPRARSRSQPSATPACTCATWLGGHPRHVARSSRTS